MSIYQNSTDFLDQLTTGAFLTVDNGEEVNTMTIGWGSIGRVWAMPVIMVMVRYSRYTHNIIKNAQDFTVSVPVKGTLKKELAGAGSLSGRDGDKFKALGLTLQPGRKTKSPVIAGGGMHYECKIRYWQEMNPDNADKDLQSQAYGDNDYHVLYFGEIIEKYQD